MRIAGSTCAHRFEHARHALRVELAGQHRLIPRRRHERHRREVVELVGPDVVDDADQRQLIEQVGRLERDAIEQVLDAPVVGRAGAADDPEDLVALLEQQLGEIRPVLTGDAGDECAFGHEVRPSSISGRNPALARSRAHDQPDAAASTDLEGSAYFLPGLCARSCSFCRSRSLNAVADDHLDAPSISLRNTAGSHTG